MNARRRFAITRDPRLAAGRIADRFDDQEIDVLVNELRRIQCERAEGARMAALQVAALAHALHSDNWKSRWKNRRQETGMPDAAEKRALPVAALEALVRELVEDARDEGYWSGCAGPELAERAARTAATHARVLDKIATLLLPMDMPAVEEGP